MTDPHTHLRALYRKHGEAGYAIVAEEAARLGIERSHLPHIIKGAWIEGRELAGWTYDKAMQQWRRADGSVVVEDTGEEWL